MRSIRGADALPGQVCMHIHTCRGRAPALRMLFLDRYVRTYVRMCTLGVGSRRAAPQCTFFGCPRVPVYLLCRPRSGHPVCLQRPRSAPVPLLAAAQRRRQKKIFFSIALADRFPPWRETNPKGDRKEKLFFAFGAARPVGEATLSRFQTQRAARKRGKKDDVVVGKMC